MGKQSHICKTWILTVVVLFLNISATYAQSRYSATSGDWNSPDVWVDQWGGAAAPPVAGNTVYIQNGHTITVTENAACSSVTFNGADAVLTVNLSVTLTVSGAVTLNNLNNNSSACLINGTGKLTCTNIAVGSGTNPGPNGTTHTHSFVSTISYLETSGSVSINSYIGTNTSRIGNGRFYLQSGTVTVGGSIRTDNENGVNTSTFSMNTGDQTGTLFIGGTTAFSPDATGTTSISLNGTNATVNYYNTGAQTVYYRAATSTTAYTNLTLSGSGVKTISNASTTINGTLSMEGTATVGTNTPTYGAGSTLQYKGSGAQAAGLEFPATFNGSGGVIIDNSSGVTISSAQTISNLLTLKNGILNIGTNILTITSTSPSAVVYTPGSFINLTTGSLQRSLASNLSGTGNNYLFPIGESGVYKGLYLQDVVTGATGPVLRASVMATGAATGDNTTIISPVDPRYWSLINTNSGNLTSAKVELFESNLTSAKTIGMASAASGVYSSIGGFSSGSTSIISPSVLNPGPYFCIGTLIYDTYYSYQTGNWNVASTWTSDPSGTLQIGTTIPGVNDKVIILTDRTVTLSTDVATQGLDITISEGGVLDQTTNRFTNDLLALHGQGVIKLASANFPSASFNTFVSAGGGTTLYNNTADFTLLSTQNTYNNLTINTADYTATQLGNITLNGNLYIETGVFRINDNTSANKLNLTINGNVTVDEGAAISVGNGVTNTTIGGSGGTVPFLNYYLNFHTIIVKGDFTNNGTVSFTNLPFPQYTAFPSTVTGATTGAASVYFQGASDNVLTCNGPTTFYNLILNKGTDKTYKLTVNSSSYENFRLFGANSLTVDGSVTSNPSLRKALWIYKGTLVLRGSVIIPSLSEGTTSGADYYIPSDGALQIDGVDVVVLSTADDYREVNLAYGVTAPDNATTGVSKGGYSALTVYGQLLVNNGYLSTRESGGIVTSSVASGQILINGGTIDAKQFLSSSGSASYLQTAGLFVLRGRLQRTPVAYSSIANLTDVTATTLGTSRADNGISTGFGSFNLENATNIYTVSGGTIRIFDVTLSSGGEAFDVKTSSSNINVTGGSLEIIPVTGTALTDATSFLINSTAPVYDLLINRTSSTSGVGLSTALTVQNDFNLISGSLTANNNNLAVGGDFTLESGTAYTPGTNTTILNGSADQVFTINLGSALSLNGFTISKTAGVNVTLVGSQDILNVTGDFRLTLGTLNDGGKTIYISGNIYNSGVHDGTGSIVLNGTSVQTIDGAGIFHNITLDNSNTAPVSLAADMTINGALTFSRDRLFNISTFNLRLNSDATIVNNGPLRFIQTAGNVGDGGLTRVYSTISDFTFPIGVTTEYTPATIGFTADPTTFGSVTVVPVNYEHPVTTINGQSLTYYWHVTSSGFTGLPVYSVSHQFIYGNSDVVGAEASYVPAVYDVSVHSWYFGTTSDINTTSNTISDWISPTNSTNFLDADYTAGLVTSFGTPRIYYSRQSGVWSALSTWSMTSHTVNNPPTVAPGANDIVVIGDNDSIILSTETPQFPLDNRNNVLPSSYYQLNKARVYCASLQIEEGSVLDIQNNPGCVFASVLSHSGGNGKIRITTRDPGNIAARFDDPEAFVYPSGDFSEFTANDGISEFYTINPEAGTYYILPSNADTYGTVILTPLGGSNIILPNISQVTIHGDLICNGSNADAWLAMTWTGIYGTIVAKTVTVEGDLKVLGGSFGFIYNGNTLQQISIGGDVYVSPGTAIDVWDTSTNNLMSIGGSLINNSSGTATSLARFINGTDMCSVEFTGANPSFVTNNPAISTTPVTIFNKVTINKGTSQTPTLTWNIGGTLTTPTDNWLTIQNGTLVYNRTGNLYISEGTDFTIPATGGLTINTASNVYISNNPASETLFLNGKLTLLTGGGNVFVGPEGNTAFNADIEYSGSGASAIDVQGGNLFVTGQIRRPIATTNGILSYTQSSGNVIIYGNNSNAAKAKLEILNSGSVFAMSGGSLSIVQGGGTTYGDLYLRPTTASVTGGTIIFTQTPSVGPAIDAVQSYHLDANIALNNLIVTGKPVVTARNATLSLMVSPLVLKGSLTLSNTNSYFSTNNVNVTITGDLVNNGTYNYGTNRTIFNGGAQNISGTAVTDFYNLEVSSQSTLTVNHNFRIYGSLDILSGNLVLNANLASLNGNLNNVSSYISDNSTGGISLAGTSQQQISGTGSFGRLELNNSTGARLNNDITLTYNLVLTMGIFDINKYQLTLNQNSQISGAPYSTTKMIKSDGVASSMGVRKFFNIGAQTFTFPVGVTGKYTPAIFTIANNLAARSVRVNPVDDAHPGVTDATNVLGYYWQIESSGIADFTATSVLQYLITDVSGDESSYVASRLDLNTYIWDKAPAGSLTDRVDEANHQITFNFSGNSDSNGDYTAGGNTAIPAVVATYQTNADGFWSDELIWTPVGTSPACPDGGPVGCNVIINNVVTIDKNYISALSTLIDGELVVPSTTYGHNLGAVDGDGTLHLENGTFPAGTYTDFFDCTGNATLEYGGNGSYTIVASLYSSVPNLLFSGTGTRTLPNKDLTICRSLVIDGATLDNTVNNRMLTINGTMERYNNGVFKCGTGTYPYATVVFGGTTAQTLGGSLGDFTGTSKFCNLEINNPAGLTINTGGIIQVKSNLVLTNGIINTSTTATLALLSTSPTAVTPTGGRTTSFVNGPLSKNIINGDEFIFPVGKGTIKGHNFTLTSTAGTTLAYTVEFFTPNSTATSIASPLEVSNTAEYWSVTSTTTTTARIKIGWDSSSDLTPLMATNGITDMRVAEYISGYWTALNSTTSGNAYTGDVSTTGNVNIYTYSSNFTTACISGTLARAAFSSTADVCGMAGIPVSFTSFDPITLDYTINYSINGFEQTAIPVTALPFTLPTPSPGAYQLTGFRFNNNSATGVVDAAVVNVYASPTTAVAGPNQSHCGLTSTTLQGNDPSPYFGLWSIIDGTGGTFGNSAQYNSTFNGDDGVTYTLRWTITNGTCTSYSDVIISFPVFAAQPGDFTTYSAQVCQGSTGNVFTVPNVSGITYGWDYSGEGETIHGNGGNSVTIDFGAAATSGTLSVTATNDCGTSAARTMTLTVPIATFSYTGSPFCQNAANPSPSFGTGGIAGTFSSSDGLVFLSTSTGQIDLAASVPGDYTVTNTANSATCGVLTASYPVTIAGQTWSGNISNDWNTAGNWSCGFIPYSTSIVSIPDVANEPLLSTGSTGTVRNIIIEAGSSMTVNGNTIQVTGSISNSGTFTATNGTIEMAGTAAQTIGADVFAGNTINNLTINNSNGVTLLGPLNVTGVVRVQSGNLSSAGNLTLISTATQTALVDGTGTGQITGSVTMQRYLPDGLGYKYFSSPFQDATVSHFGDDMNLGAAFPTFYRYDESQTSSGWVSYITPTDPLVPLAGYSVNFGPSTSAIIADVSGVVNNGTMSISLLNHNNTYTKGFNLVGNPYPSPIDWDALSGWTKTNIDDALYFFTASTDQYSGTYSAYINGISTDGNSSNIVPSMQGFFVHVSDGGYPVTGQLAMDNSVRVADFSQPFLKSTGDSKGKSLIRISASLNNYGLKDPLVIRFDDLAQIDFANSEDALKMMNTDSRVPNFYMLTTAGTKLSINTLPDPLDSLYTVPLGIKTLISGTVTLKVNDKTNLSTLASVYLVDATAGVKQDLLLNDEYSVYLAAGEYTNRFSIVFAKGTTDVPDVTDDNELFNAYSVDGTLWVKVNYLPGDKGVITITSFDGRVIFIRNIFEKGNYDYRMRVSDGIYIVSITSGNTRKSKKIFIH